MSLKSRLDAGDFVILAEMEPPKGIDVSGILANALKVKGCVDAFVVPEMSSAVMRMSSLGGAMVLQGKNMETVMQVCCRDRNRLALQGDLLAASACGVENIMVVPGENTSFGDHQQARPVYDIDTSGLLAALKKLKGGRDMAGVELAGSPSFCILSNVKPSAPGEFLEEELREMDKKAEAGVDAFITPPLFDLSSLKPFLAKKGAVKEKIIPTVLLLKSVGMARYIARNVESVNIPDSVIKRIQKAPDKSRECIAIARETIDLLRSEGFGGVNVSTLGWEEKLPEVLGIM